MTLAEWLMNGILLVGFMWRNGIADPIGDQDRVYGWSCRALAAKLATASRENERE